MAKNNLETKTESVKIGLHKKERRFFIGFFSIMLFIIIYRNPQEYIGIAIASVVVTTIGFLTIRHINRYMGLCLSESGITYNVFSGAMQIDSFKLDWDEISSIEHNQKKKKIIINCAERKIRRFGSSYVIADTFTIKNILAIPQAEVYRLINDKLSQYSSLKTIT